MKALETHNYPLLLLNSRESIVSVTGPSLTSETWVFEFQFFSPFVNEKSKKRPVLFPSLTLRPSLSLLLLPRSLLPSLLTFIIAPNTPSLTLPGSLKPSRTLSSSAL